MLFLRHKGLGAAGCCPSVLLWEQMEVLAPSSCKILTQEAQREAPFPC